MSSGQTKSCRRVTRGGCAKRGAFPHGEGPYSGRHVVVARARAGRRGGRDGKPLNIELTSEWPAERIARYGPDITAALRKLVDRFPNVWTMTSLAEDIFSGKSHQADHGRRRVPFLRAD